MSGPSTSSRSATDKDWMFCPYTGAILQIDEARNVAACALSGYAVSLDDLEDRVRVVHETDIEGMARRHGLEMLVKTEREREEEEELLRARTRATVDEPCPKCGHQGLEFYTLQLRSADEGSTVRGGRRGRAGVGVGRCGRCGGVADSTLLRGAAS